MSEKRRKMMSNPLYVVSNNGVDVEQANDLLDMILKRTGLDKLLPVFETILQMILAEVQTYPVFMEVKKVFDKLFEKIIELLFQAQQLAQKVKL